MAKLTQAEELQAAIRGALHRVENGVSSAEIAKSLYETEQALLDPFIEQWAIEKLVTLIRAERRKAVENDPTQASFDGFLELKLPKTLESNGHRVTRENATIGYFRKRAVQLRQQKSPALADVEAAIALMRKYTTRSRYITWGEVVKREAGKTTRR